MKVLITICAVASLAVALPQRRVPLKPEQPQSIDDQQAAEQNYNNYNPQQDYRQQDYRQQQQQQQLDYRQQQQQNDNTQHQENRQHQQQQQEYKTQKIVDDFRPRVQLETTTYIPIIRFDKEQGTDGSYKTAYETGNNIQAEESGFLKSVGEDQSALVQHGSYSYTAPNGEVITVEYTADEFGFRVKGDHIPTPPPVSPEIQKGLDLIYAGIKANAERDAQDLKNNPELAGQQQDRAALDYKGHYYQQ